MSEERELAAQYRKHAQSLNALADFDTQEKTKAAFRRIAQSYERIAEALEGIARTKELARRSLGGTAKGEPEGS